MPNEAPKTTRAEAVAVYLELTKDMPAKQKTEFFSAVGHEINTLTYSKDYENIIKIIKGLYEQILAFYADEYCTGGFTSSVPDWAITTPETEYQDALDRDYGYYS